MRGRQFLLGDANDDREGVGHEGHWSEIAHWIKGHAALTGDVDGDRAGGHQQRVPVGCGLGHLVGPQRTGRAGDVLHRGALAEGLDQGLGHDPTPSVDQAARGPGHDDADGT